MHSCALTEAMNYDVRLTLPQETDGQIAPDPCHFIFFHHTLSSCPVSPGGSEDHRQNSAESHQPAEGE